MDTSKTRRTKRPWTDPETGRAVIPFAPRSWMKPGYHYVTVCKRGDTTGFAGHLVSLEGSCADPRYEEAHIAARYFAEVLA